MRDFGGRIATSNLFHYYYCRKDFMRDMCILAQIRDPNIARIVALVEEEPFGAVFEYGEHGDLPYYIRNQEKPNNEAPLR